MFLESLLKSVLFRPERLSYPDAWVGHIPFAAWLIKSLRPAIFVELGTHSGNSYFSFCQAVKEGGVPTRCYAIDTWKGDEHAGYYDESVFQNLYPYHQKHYEAFSRLLRLTFDDASQYFSDGSIDLLHIDGLHTYEAAKHDFETWLPKLSPHAVVLFHDTNVRERGFGIWKLWEELCTQYPRHLEFVHSHGLGVLQLSQGKGAFNLDWLRPDSPHRRLLLDFFAAIGQRIVEQYQHQELTAQVAVKEQAVQDLTAQVQDLTAQVAERNAQLIKQSEQINMLSNELTSIKNARSWSIYIRLIKSFRKFFPQNSVQMKILDFNWRILRAIYRNGFFSFLRIATKRTLDYLSRNLLRTTSSKSTGSFMSIKPVVTKKEGIERASNIDIIVCVHNALDDVKRCLESIEKNTQHPYQLSLVDDGSGEPTKNYLQEFAQQKKHCKLIRNDKAGGYTRAANKGLRASTAEFIILLNSDTIVGPEWLDRLYAAIKSDEKFGVAGPLSNTASWQSIPELEEYGDWATNSLPTGISAERMSQLVAKYSSQLRPEVKLLNGFCMMIKKSLIEEIGYFDEESFGEGYGEEDDFNLRARQAGWKLVLADDVYIFHAQSKSYSNERRHRLSERAGKTLRQKHSSQLVAESVAYMHPNRIMEGIRARSKVLKERDEHLQKGRQEFSGKKVLFILPVSSAGGGANVVIDEARSMQQMGVDVRIFNLEEYKIGFLKSYPHLDIPVIFGQKDDLMHLSLSYDSMIATANYSVEWLKLVKEKNQNIILGYYIQGFEVLMYQDDSSDYKRAMESYTLIENMRLFSKTEWVKNTVFQNTGAKISTIGISVNTDLFCPRHVRKFGTKPVIITAMIRPGSSYRNPTLTMDVLRQIEHELGQNVQIRLFGSDDIRDPSLDIRWDFNWIQAGRLTQPQVANFLSDADIFVDFSTHQAMGLTALEAMACGCAVIVPEYGGAVEFVTHGETGMVVDTTNPRVCFDILKNLVQNDSLRTNIQLNGMKRVAQYYPEKAAYKILKTLLVKSDD